MNAQPHAHQIDIDSRSSVYTYIRYGDQTRHVDPAFPLYGLRLRLAVRKIVKKHDQASRRAGRLERTVKEFNNRTVTFNPDQWGSKQRRKNA